MKRREIAIFLALCQVAAMGHAGKVSRLSEGIVERNIHNGRQAKAPQTLILTDLSGFPGEFSCYQASLKSKDVIFTEILPDPTPPIGLPNAEFVEIYNRSQNSVNVSGWKLSDGTSTGIFPSQSIAPGEYWIVTAASSLALFAGYGKTIGLSNFPSLNNDGESLTLKGADNLTLDSINYAIDWYIDRNKRNGGWSLELIDPGNPCGESDNWAAAEDSRGGTPGKKNSVFANKPDMSGPRVISIFPESSTRLAVDFSEKLDPGSISTGNFSIHPTVSVLKVSFRDISLRTILVDMPNLARLTYTIDVKNIRDCNGNLIQPCSFQWGLVESPAPYDVVVNEILFNPRSGGVDFVEMYNVSSRHFNMNNWKIGHYVNGIPTSVSILFSRNVLLSPGGFAVFTTDPTIVKLQYPRSVQENLFETSLPTFDDDNSSVAFLDDKGKVLDELSYSKNWHSGFIKNDEGVSLERIDARAFTNNSANWTSASSAAGFATPGYANSQGRQGDELDDGKVLVVPEIFSPGDGMNDFVQIQYRFEVGGWVANVKVFDQQEHLLKTLASNEILGTEGFFRWDGSREDGSKARLGYYVIWFEVYNGEGAVKVYRERVVVSSH